MDQPLGDETRLLPADGRKGSREPAWHFFRFLVSGALALSVDAAVLAALTKGLGVDPFVSRLIAISVAMVVGWLAHRRITFALTRRPSAREFVAYASVAWTAAAVNYAVYAGILLASPSTPPLLSLVIASLITMAVSYAGMRFGVFGRPGSHSHPTP